MRAMIIRNIIEKIKILADKTSRQECSWDIKNTAYRLNEHVKPLDQEQHQEDIKFLGKTQDIINAVHDISRKVDTNRLIRNSPDLCIKGSADKVDQEIQRELGKILGALEDLRSDVLREDSAIIRKTRDMITDQPSLLDKEVHGPATQRLLAERNQETNRGK